MLEETATVKRIEPGLAWVVTEPMSACGHCGANGNNGGACGSGLLAGLLARRQPLIPVVDDLGVQVGERVVIGVADQLLVRAALTAYLLPLLSTVLTAWIATAAGVGDGAVALLAGVGLVAGLAVTRVTTGGSAARERYRPALLRRQIGVGQPEFTMNINDLKSTGASS